MSTYDTLSEAINSLNNQGFTESFKAGNNKIKALFSKKVYNPDEVQIVDTFRFEGMTNPQDQTTLYALKTKDDVKGTLTQSYSTDSNNNDAILQKIS